MRIFGSQLSYPRFGERQKRHGYTSTCSRKSSASSSRRVEYVGPSHWFRVPEAVAALYRVERRPVIRTMNISFAIYAIALACSLLVIKMPTPASAADYCFESAGQAYGVAPVLLWAISNQESRHNNAAVNRNKNGSVDVCHMQINDWWLRKKKISPELWSALQSDPCTCTKVGAWVLAQCVQQHGYSWNAVACYNATDKTPESRAKGNKYAWNIYYALKKAERLQHQARVSRANYVTNAQSSFER